MESSNLDFNDSKPTPLLTPEGNWLVSGTCLIISFIAMYQLGYASRYWAGFAATAFIISYIVSARWTRFSHVWGTVFVVSWILIWGAAFVVNWILNAV